MDFFKRTIFMKIKKLVKILYPPLWVLIPLVIICIIGLIYIFVSDYSTQWFAYAGYILSFYTLTAVVMLCIKKIPVHYRLAKERVYKNPLGERYMTDMKFRTHISLFASLAVNLLYVGINVISAVLYNSNWFWVLAFYYTILAIMRFLLVKGIGTDRLTELRRSRICGAILLTINLALSASVLMILYQGKGYSYSGNLIYAMAAYTFYITTIAIMNLIKYRKFGNPVMSMTKIISMAAALVSMLSLETAMFSSFGDGMSEESQRLMIILTGAGVSICIISMSVYSIIKNTKEIRKIS